MAPIIDENLHEEDAPEAEQEPILKNRSVNDFDTVDGLRIALRTKDYLESFVDFGRDFPHALEGSHFGAPRDDDSMSEASTVPDMDPELDWILTNYNAELSQTQSLSEELKRLQVLKSYLILDSEREANFERLTALASRMFHVPIALVSLVDLGRQWFMSNRGLGDVRETPRKLAFCAHAIISKEDMLIVPNATLDSRFSENPLVTGPPNIRFYAGAPLLCPEGYKLGTLCLIDSKPRPDGLSLEEKQNLRELTALVVDAMVERRREKMRVLQDKSQIIATTAHDLLTPLTGVQMSLSVLMDDEDFKKSLPPGSRDLMETAVQCSDVMNRICHQAIETFRGDVAEYEKSKQQDGSDAVQKMKTDHRITIVVKDMVRNLNMVMEPYPKQVPLLISVDPLVPTEFVGDDLKIFRSAINYMTNACKKTEKGSVHLKIYVGGRSRKPKLVFECEDTGPGVSMDTYPYLFRPFREDDLEGNSNGECLQVDEKGDIITNKHRVSTCSANTMTNSGLGLYSVATQISSLGGEYGFRPREVDNQVCGAIFWFSLPLVVPPSCNWNLREKRAELRKAKAEKKSQADLGSRSLVSTNTVRSFSKRCVIETTATVMTNGADAVPDKEKTADTDVEMEDVSGASEHKVYTKTTPMDEAQSKAIFNSVSQVLAADVPGGPQLAASEPIAYSEARSTSKSERQPMVVAKKESKVAPGARTRQALVIDDSLVIRKSMVRALGRLGYEVSQATNGLEGLKAMQTRVFDVVLLDFLMPVMDGLDCAQQYREWEKAHRPWFDQFIIGISAHASPNDVDKGKAAGMNDFKPKPVTMKCIKELVASEELLSVSKRLDEILVVEDDKPAEEQTPEPSTANGHAYSLSNQKAKFVGRQAVCLIAQDSSRSTSKTMKEAVEQRGWQTVVVNDGEDALRLLKMRNWDAVFLDTEMPRLTGSRCVSRFREWEKENRIARQSNIIFMSSEYIPSPTGLTTSAVYPSGFDGALGKPVLVKDLIAVLKTAESTITDSSHSASIVAR